MELIEALPDFRFPTAEFPLASLSVRLDDLAGRLGLPVHCWDEDGLGPSRGLACRLPSGRVFVLVEHQLSLRYSYVRGPNVLVDAADIGVRGVRDLLSEFLAAFEITPGDLTWVVDRSAEADAARLADEAPVMGRGPERPFQPDVYGGS